ncbi:GNAT family N-acetyltransferase [Cupriavidus gilardii]|mgnify:CR=1 FL=1|uniref:GNAT family N-acetyltransferase n=2 Tax=Cupriavidus TaxID=106589 RepID=A0A5A8ERK5_9BURK|nr:MULTISPECIES: GNAT family N-acetyltransferase [Cupriavidus]ALD90778.1 Histone acetyltransferase HPA2-related acetyltransferase [Cupriavidus gilardii CR3]QQE05859.1 GNAT family N-acetyltransferase [Cupriavidus sp. ISTL7]KAA0180179.1 GNAT family N-acetyltransferase [Cupriavidus gilardii]KAA6125252.1 GNAT family N-acetyltransferase [Cupriavidus cauae]KAB0597805.1 GNAT family N-acetyltransferase [Cupriavidus gilardii]
MSQLPSPSSPHFHYRLATASDWGQIAAVTQEAYAQYELEIMEDCRASFQQGMRSVLATNTSDMEWWVAETDHGISGAVLFCHPGATLQALDGSTVTLALPEARLLSVSPQARGLGLGRTLMQICIERARDIGAQALVVRTMPEMGAANRLCQQMGFVKRTEAGARSGPLERLVDYVYAIEPKEADAPQPGL